MKRDKNFGRFLFWVGFIVFFQLFLGNRCVAQGRQYTYDNSGNRILRNQIVLKVANEPDGGPYELRNQTEGLDTASGIINDFGLEGRISIFPNPTQSFVEVFLSNPKAVVNEAILYDSRGNILAKLGKSSDNLTFDLSKEARGSYYIVLNVNGAKQHYKIIKQ